LTSGSESECCFNFKCLAPGPGRGLPAALSPFCIVPQFEPFVGRAGALAAGSRSHTPLASESRVRCARAAPSSITRRTTTPCVSRRATGSGGTRRRRRAWASRPLARSSDRELRPRAGVRSHTLPSREKVHRQKRKTTWTAPGVLCSPGRRDSTASLTPLSRVLRARSAILTIRVLDSTARFLEEHPVPASRLDVARSHEDAARCCK
jgi:hypothetical protein